MVGQMVGLEPRQTVLPRPLELHAPHGPHGQCDAPRRGTIRAQIIREGTVRGLAHPTEIALNRQDGVGGNRIRMPCIRPVFHQGVVRIDGADRATSEKLRIELAAADRQQYNSHGVNITYRHD